MAFRFHFLEGAKKKTKEILAGKRGLGEFAKQTGLGIIQAADVFSRAGQKILPTLAKTTPLYWATRREEEERKPSQSIFDIIPSLEKARQRPTELGSVRSGAEVGARTVPYMLAGGAAAGAPKAFLSPESGLAARLGVKSIANIAPDIAIGQTLYDPSYGTRGKQALFDVLAGSVVAGGSEIIGGLKGALKAPAGEEIVQKAGQIAETKIKPKVKPILEELEPLAKETKKTGEELLEEASTIKSAKETFVDALKKVRGKLRGYQLETKTGRATQLSKVESARKAYLAKNPGDYIGAAHAELKSARGEFARKDMKIGLNIDDTTKNVLFEDIGKRLSSAERLKAYSSFNELAGGEMIAKSEIEVLEKGLNMDLAPVLLEEGLISGGKATRAVQEIGGIKRALMTTGELSRTLRQNIVAMSRNPIKGTKDFAKSLKSWGLGHGEENYLKHLDEIKSSPNFTSAKDMGIRIEEMGGKLSARPEEFATRYLDNFPIIRNAARQFIALGNITRMRRWDEAVTRLVKKGITPATDPIRFQNLAQNINASTGAKEVGGLLAKFHDTLNATAFSPRLMYSRWHYLNPRTYISKKNRGARLEAAKDMGSTIAMVSGLLYATKQAGAEVEANPLSSDFGKAKIGNTRFEVAGGFTPYIRSFAQFVMGAKKDPETGEIVSTKGYGKGGRLGTLSTFARGKLAPLPGDILDIIAGTNIVGEQTTGKKKIIEIAPMAYRDIYEAMTDEEKTAFGSLLSIPASVLGVGVDTYGGEEDKLRKKKERDYVKWLDKKGTLKEKAIFRTAGTKSPRYKGGTGADKPQQFYFLEDKNW